MRKAWETELQFKVKLAEFQIQKELSDHVKEEEAISELKAVLNQLEKRNKDVT